MTALLDRMDVHRLLTAACAEAGSNAAWARLHVVNRQYLGDVLAGRADPGASILRGLGLKKIARYVDLRTSTP